mmetsp:Transcript_15552/g.48637  ORF Transcript_15552/g.48637 Transcript_15552/m.48637 type:complete len:574 (-) Transcript_15552:244-1965(-)
MDRERILLRLLPRERRAVLERRLEGDKEGDGQDHQEGPGDSRGGGVARGGGAADRGDRREVQAGDPGLDRGRADIDLPHRGRVVGPVRGAARRLDGRAEREGGRPRVCRGRVLARRRDARVAAENLRHGVEGGVAARGAQAARRGGEEAGPPRPRPEAGPVLDPGGRGRRAGLLAPARRRDARRHRGALAPRARPRRVRAAVHAPRREHRALEDLGPPRLLRGLHVRRHGRRGRAVPAQADELPLPLPRLQGLPQVLPRPPDPLGRARHGLPLRALRDAPRPHARPGLHAGRRPRLLHRRAARGRDPPRPRPHRDHPLQVRLHHLRRHALHASRQVRRLGRDLGQGHGRPRRRPRPQALELRGRPRRRRLLRPKDRHQDPRRPRPQVAVLHRPVRLQPPRALRPPLRRVRLEPAPTDNAAPRHLRQRRALLRRPHRVHRGRPPPLARPHAAQAPPRHRRRPGLRQRGPPQGRRRRRPMRARPRQGPPQQADSQRRDPARPAHGRHRREGGRLRTDLRSRPRPRRPRTGRPRRFLRRHQARRHHRRPPRRAGRRASRHHRRRRRRQRGPRRLEL